MESCWFVLAEEKGFEPLIPFRVYTLSRRAGSTTPALLLMGGKNTIFHYINIKKGHCRYRFYLYTPYHCLEFMVNTLFDFFPFAVGIAISPVPIITVILALFSKKAKWNGPAFLLGWAMGIAVVAIPVLIISESSNLVPETKASLTASIVRLALGILLLLIAIRNWKKRPKKGEEGVIPKWLMVIETVSPLKVFAVGFFFADLTNPKNTALTVAGTLSIAHSEIPATAKPILLAIFILMSSVGIAIPVIYYLAGGSHAKKILDIWKKWLIQNNATVMATLFLVFGSILISQGMKGLLA